MSDEVKLTWGKTENDLLQRWPKSADGTPEEPALLTVAMDTNAETDMLCAMLRPQRPSVASILASCRRVTGLVRQDRARHARQRHMALCAVLDARGREKSDPPH